MAAGKHTVIDLTTTTTTDTDELAPPGKKLKRGPEPDPVPASSPATPATPATRLAKLVDDAALREVSPEEMDDTIVPLRGWYDKNLRHVPVAEAEYMLLVGGVVVDDDDEWEFGDDAVAKKISVSDALRTFGDLEDPYEILTNLFKAATTVAVRSMVTTDVTDDIDDTLSCF
jgi:hypothetical protein